MNRYERHMLAAKLAAIEAETAARAKAEEYRLKQAAISQRNASDNEQEMRKNAYPMFYDHAWAFDANLNTPDPQRNQR